MKNSNQKYWDKKYREQRIGWNIGYASTPIKEFIDQVDNRGQKILIPGAGNAYEAEYLFRQGFQNIFIADISIYPLNNFLERVPDFPKHQILNKDFFDINGKFNLIIEQTFFCALLPTKRSAYARKMADLLNPGGQLVGLLFNFPLTKNGPPYGGSKKEYQNLFSKRFEIQKLEPAYNSIPPRQGKEYFIKMKKI